MNIKEVIQACKNGDSGAQKAFFMHFSGPVFGQILRYVGDEFHAKDVLQNVFLILYRALAKFEYESDVKLKAWIKTITVRECIRSIKKHKAIWQLTEDLDNHYELADSYSVLSKMQSEELLDLLKLLPEGYRVVFNMYAIEGFSHKEIAEEMGITESTSRSQLTRARQLLQQYTLKLSKNG